MGLKIGTPKEVAAGEARVAMTPDSAQQIAKLGYECLIETGAGREAGFPDDAYRFSGVSVERRYVHLLMSGISAKSKNASMEPYAQNT